MASEDLVAAARALVLHDMEVTGIADPSSVSLLEEAVAQRAWWVQQWAQGVDYVIGLVAQDVQDGLLESAGRWPVCRLCGTDSTHALYVDPDLGGPDPHWVCEESGRVVARIGGL